MLVHVHFSKKEEKEIIIINVEGDVKRMEKVQIKYKKKSGKMEINMKERKGKTSSVLGNLCII